MDDLFGVVSMANRINDLIYGTDYHAHLGMRRGGLAVRNSEGYTRAIHNLVCPEISASSTAGMGAVTANR
jgi:amidophosphoribosyltransferase